MDDLELSDETLAAIADAAGKPADFAGVVGHAKMFYTEWRPLPMTAKELHALYAPLWAAVPDCVPLWLHYDAESDPCWVLEGDAGDTGVVRTETAAVLCRCAAEDWMIHQFNQRCAYISLARMSGEDYFVNRHSPGILDFDANGKIIESAQYRTSHRGPTIHHALVRACLAVHGSSAPIPAPPSSPQPPHPPA